jgi:hypothetical protein
MPNASLQSIAFDTTRYRAEGESADKRVWFTPDGDGVGLYFFNKPPDIPARLPSAAALRQLYENALREGPMQMAEFRVETLDGVACIWMVLKTLQQPHGMTYLGSITIPFADFSFVLKMQCTERGVTGMREAALVLKGQMDGSVTIAEDGKFAGDWNPDDARHDVLFPHHPVSRLRREFTHIKQSLRIDEHTKREIPFPLPADKS